MSRIYWHGEHHTSELLGSERAYMGMLCDNIAAQVMYRGIGSRHPIENLLPPGVTLSNYGDRDGAARMYLRSLITDNQLVFGGDSYYCNDLTLNTVIATGSPYLALLARLHGYCELHAWVAEEHREWLADIITEGRARNIFRPGMGWEAVATHLRNGDGGNVYTSYSVCDGFPGIPDGWMNDAWPPEQRGAWDYTALTAEQEIAVQRRQDEWYDFPAEEQWARSASAVAEKRCLQLTPENLLVPMFSGSTSLWDAVASPEWRGETTVLAVGAAGR